MFVNDVLYECVIFHLVTFCQGIRMACNNILSLVENIHSNWHLVHSA